MLIFRNWDIDVQSKHISPNVLGAIRTLDIQLRRLTLYPTELRGLVIIIAGDGIEPSRSDYETDDLPLIYPAVVPYYMYHRFAF